LHPAGSVQELTTASLSVCAGPPLKYILSI
jgi:hypothetical protein